MQLRKQLKVLKQRAKKKVNVSFAFETVTTGVHGRLTSRNKDNITKDKKETRHTTYSKPAC